jgi:stage VI sporulation protein D
MTEHKAGLRFDIYERVHLAEELPEMKELDSIELIPHIQVTAEGDQAMLKGNLWLAGQYMTEQDTESRTFEHYIPVEISLPLNRVNRLEDITVDIENFDIDLLSPRVLNVTGVLSLQGMNAEPADMGTWLDEETTFVHEAEEIRVDKPKAVVPPLPPNETLVGLDTVAGNGTWLESIESEPVHEGGLEWEAESPLLENVIPSTADALLLEDKKEVKVAFGSKNPTGEEHQLSIKNLLKNDEESKWSSPTLVGDRENAAEIGREGVRGDELEWKRLFLGGRGNERQFQKVRLCIVQKEETIDGIAERYSINPREILLYNGLSGQQVAVGQVIYIPTS